MVFNATFNNIPVLISYLERPKIFWKQRWNTPNKVSVIYRSGFGYGVYRHFQQYSSVDILSRAP